MKNIFLTIISLLTLIHINGQNNDVSEVAYTFYINAGQASISTDCSLIYSHKTQKSTFINFGFKEIPEDIITTNTEIDGTENTNIEKYDNNDGQKPEYQKLYKQDSLFAFEGVYGEKKYHIIKEKLPQFDWEIQNDKKEVLNILVQKATLKFRGRDYEAWFAPSLQISDGPYKFYGLPGLILEIASLDGRYKFEAYALNLYQKDKDFEIKLLPIKYKNSMILDIKEKLKLEKKNEEKEIKYQLSKNPNIQDFKIQTNSIETDFPNYKE